MTETDRKVIRGLFVKQIKDFDEDFRERMKNITLFQRLKDHDPEASMPNVSRLSGDEFEESKFEEAPTNRSTSRQPIKEK